MKIIRCLNTLACLQEPRAEQRKIILNSLLLHLSWTFVYCTHFVARCFFVSPALIFYFKAQNFPLTRRKSIANNIFFISTQLGSLRTHEISIQISSFISATKARRVNKNIIFLRLNILFSFFLHLRLISHEFRE